MSVNATWEHYKGKEFLYLNYTACKSTDEMIALMEKEVDLLKIHGGKSCILADFRDTTIEAAFMEKARELGGMIEAHTERAAVLGAAGAKKLLMMVYNRISEGNLQPFDDIKSAKNYLVN